MTQPVLENSHVRLEPLGEAHREPLRAIGDDPDLWRYATTNQHGVDFDAWFDARISGMSKNGDITFAIFDKHTDQWAGSSSYLMVTPAHQRLEIGWTWYAKPFWAGHVNPATKLALLTHGFEAMGLTRIEFKVDSLNTRSLAAMAKLGAVREGTFRNHFVMPDARLRHSVYFSIMPDEWPDVKTGLEARLDA